jgi:hypothetical protein
MRLPPWPTACKNFSTMNRVSIDRGGPNMRIMYLNHTSKREGSPEYYARIDALANS